MMKTRITPLIACLMVALFGCVPSVHPIFTSSTLVFDESLLGTWRDEKDKQQFLLQRAGDDHYRLTHTDESGHAGSFTAHLAEVQGIRFFDIFPLSPDQGISGFQKFHLFPTHTIYRIEETAGGYRLSSIDGNWLNSYLKKHPDAIRHTFSGKRCLITASTEELQDFFVENQDRFTASLKLVKQ